jgi:hypothetical protein
MSCCGRAGIVSNINISGGRGLDGSAGTTGTTGTAGTTGTSGTTGTTSTKKRSAVVTDAQHGSRLREDDVKWARADGRREVGAGRRKWR